VNKINFSLFFTFSNFFATTQISLPKNPSELPQNANRLPQNANRQFFLCVCKATPRRGSTQNANRLPKNANNIPLNPSCLPTVESVYMSSV